MTGGGGRREVYNVWFRPGEWCFFIDHVRCLSYPFASAYACFGLSPRSALVMLTVDYCFVFLSTDSAGFISIEKQLVSLVYTSHIISSETMRRPPGPLHGGHAVAAASFLCLALCWREGARGAVDEVD